MWLIVLRQALTSQEQTVLAEDIFVRETEMWNRLAGPTFRCELLVSTHCSDESDDLCFSASAVAWSERTMDDTPLLVQCRDRGMSFSAMAHRYSGKQESTVGVHGKCCITGMHKDFSCEPT